jgi:hypothetical protein
MPRSQRDHVCSSPDRTRTKRTDTPRPPSSHNRLEKSSNSPAFSPRSARVPRTLPRTLPAQTKRRPLVGMRGTVWVTGQGDRVIELRVLRLRCLTATAAGRLAAAHFAAARAAAAMTVAAAVLTAAVLPAAAGLRAAAARLGSATTGGLGGAGRLSSAATGGLGGAAGRFAAALRTAATVEQPAAVLPAAGGRAAAARLTSRRRAARRFGTTRGLATAAAENARLRIRRAGRNKQAGDEQSRQHNAGLHGRNS